MIPNVFFFSACAKKFADEGSKVVLCARNEVELKRVKKEISGDEVIMLYLYRMYLFIVGREAIAWLLRCEIIVSHFEKTFLFWMK